MKKMNNKGFTLIELLAVVVILLAISVVAISSISAAIERNKAKQNDARISVIVSYAKLYYDEHKNSESDKCIELDKLIDAGLLDEEEKKDVNGDEFIGVVKFENGKFTFIENGVCS